MARRLAGLRRILACLSGLALPVAAAPAPARAAAVAPAPPPQEWVRYAGLVGEALSRLLAGDTPQAGRLRAELEGTPSKETPETVSLPVKVWVGPDGAITRVDSPSLTSAGAADLQAMTAGQPVGEPPPAALRFPIRLKLNLEPIPDPGDPQDQAAR
jgi:hypothetical protein